DVCAAPAYRRSARRLTKSCFSGALAETKDSEGHAVSFSMLAEGVGFLSGCVKQIHPGKRLHRRCDCHGLRIVAEMARGTVRWRGGNCIKFRFNFGASRKGLGTPISETAARWYCKG